MQTWNAPDQPQGWDTPRIPVYGLSGIGDFAALNKLLGLWIPKTGDFGLAKGLGISCV